MFFFSITLLPIHQGSISNHLYLIFESNSYLQTYVLRMAERGYPAPVKLLRYLAWAIARRRSSTFQILTIDDGMRPPGKNWTQGFYKRHVQLRPRKLRPIKWARQRGFSLRKE
jgi:hypothetical protein